MIRLHCKPEYLYRPQQLLSRLCRDSDGQRWVTLPWGLPILVSPIDTLGNSIIRSGLYELGLTEALWRLTQPGDCAVDVGANVGYMTSVMACRAGFGGSVISFEPHPGLFQELKAHATKWQAEFDVACIHLFQNAVGGASGRAPLYVPAGFHTNRGLASLTSPIAEGAERIEVDICRLDEVIRSVAPKVLKVDVEGHELDVLKGASHLLTAGRVRAVLFEENDDFPSPASTYLTELGYTIFGLDTGWTGPRLVRPRTGQRIGRSWEPPTLVATREPATVENAFQKCGWHSLRCKAAARKALQT